MSEGFFIFIFKVSCTGVYLFIYSYTEDGPKLSAPVASRTQGASRSSRKKRKEN